MVKLGLTAANLVQANCEQQEQSANLLYCKLFWPLEFLWQKFKANQANCEERICNQRAESGGFIEINVKILLYFVKIAYVDTYSLLLYSLD